MGKKRAERKEAKKVAKQLLQARLKPYENRRADIAVDLNAGAAGTDETFEVTGADSDAEEGDDVARRKLRGVMDEEGPANPIKEGPDGDEENPLRAKVPLRFRDRVKMSIPMLKKALMDRLGVDRAVELGTFIEPHVGNAYDPFVSLQLQNMHGAVEIPANWTLVRAHLSKQLLREASTASRALGGLMTASTDTMDIIRELVALFQPVTPLRVRTYGIALTRHGEVWDEHRWYPQVQVTPGAPSRQLLAALGIKEGKIPEPMPWLADQQSQIILPPSFPNSAFPGFNAPIPQGAMYHNWGKQVTINPQSRISDPFLYPVNTNDTRPTFRCWGAIPPRSSLDKK